MPTAETLITENLDVWSSAIKAKSSAGRGGGKKQMLYGVKKLRELILELAVRGLLVPQNPNDESASELLKRIATKKARLIKDGEIKKQPKLPPVQNDEFPFSLPSGWRFERVGNLTSKLGSGSTPRGGKSAYVSDGIIFLRSQNVWNDGLKLDDTAFIPEETHEIMQNTQVFPRDVLLNITGASLGRSTIFPKELKTANVSQHVTIIRLIESEMAEFLHLGILSPLVQKLVWGRQVGMAIEGLSKKVLEKFEFPIPPLAEQHRIVAKVDELMALCDQLEQQQEGSLRTHDTLVKTLLAALTAASECGQFAQAWQRIEANFDTLFTTESSIDQLKQTILQLAVMGKLVEQDPEDEKAERLVQAIAQDKSAALKAKSMRKTKAIEPYEDDLPFDLPSSWIWSQLGLLVVAEDGALCDGPFGSKLKTSHYIEEKGFAVIRLGNIGIGEFIWGKEGYITKAHFELLSGNQTKPGDLIVAGMAEPLVRCCEIPPSLGPAINKADCFRVRLHEKMKRTYIRHFLNSPVAKSLAAEENHGMTRQRINSSNAKALPIPIPPLAEQRRIVAKVDELLALCDQLKVDLKTAQETQLNLADSLVESAIS